jgi:hypothetical protein
MNQKIKPLTIEIEKDLWEEFKTIIPRIISLNEAIVNLIREKVEKEIKKK